MKIKAEGKAGHIAESLDELAMYELPVLGKAESIAVLADKISPVLAFERLRRKSDYAFLLESSDTDSRLARFSILAFDPLEVVRMQANKLELSLRDPQSGRYKRAFEIDICDPLEFLKKRLNALKNTASDLPGDLPFAAAYVGYLGYGLTAGFDSIKQQDSDELEVPDGMLAFYDALVVFDHKERSLRIVSFKSKEHCLNLLDNLQDESGQPERALCRLPLEISDADLYGQVRPSMDKETYCRKVRRCQELIAEGEAFQIVLAHRFERTYAADPFQIYRVLQSINPSPYGYYLQFPDFTYLGASPERFLSCRQGVLSLTALAGTRRRGLTEKEETALAEDLQSSEKELAEHYMLVDLGRNDLGRVAAIGTVRHGKIAEIIKYAQVMHLSTEISAELASGLTCFEAVRSCFPAGTVSGAPKIRAMEILSEIEPERRGIYSGLVGYFDICGNSDSAIAIRSALVKGGKAQVSAGAGIVMDSDPESEYTETRQKAASVLKAIAMAERLHMEGEK